MSTNDGADPGPMTRIGPTGSKARQITTLFRLPSPTRRLCYFAPGGGEALLRNIETVPPSGAHLCLYVGLEGTAPELGLSGTNLWIYPGPEHDGNLQRALSDPDAPLPSVFISSGSAKDPDFERRHPGHSTVEVVAGTLYDFFRRWENTRWKKRGPDYEAYKAFLTDRLLQTLYRYVPAAQGRILHAELSTPLSTRDQVNHPHGEIYGLAHTPRRFELRCLGPRTLVRNLYLMGQDASTCGDGCICR